MPPELADWLDRRRTWFGTAMTARTTATISAMSAPKNLPSGSVKVTGLLSL
ncbi:hypothetical protein [Streptomyces mirabilis]|uniref:hypothetical protein n=1 Tax=Streptomyces mirabilis TaxID=68239 RepID=UPI00331C18DE